MLDSTGEFAVGDHSLEAAAAGAEEPAVPRRLGQPDFDLDAGIRGGDEGCGDPAEGRKTGDLAGTWGAEDPTGVVRRRGDRRVVELQGLEIGAWARHRGRAGDRDTGKQAHGRAD